MQKKKANSQNNEKKKVDVCGENGAAEKISSGVPKRSILSPLTHRTLSEIRSARSSSCRDNITVSLSFLAIS